MLFARKSRIKTDTDGFVIDKAGLFLLHRSREILMRPAIDALCLFRPALVLGWLVLSHLTPPPAIAAKHVIGYTTISFARAPVWIANDLRLYKKNNVDAEVVFLRGGTVGTQALISGSASFIASSGSAAIEAILSGADLVILAGYSNLLDQMLVTKKEINDIPSLKSIDSNTVSEGWDWTNTSPAPKKIVASWGFATGK